MADFSDREDHHLVRLARQYEDRGEKISWAALAHEMKFSKKDVRALKRRLTTLKTTHGKRLRDFPCRFFKSAQPAQTAASMPKKPLFILPRLTSSMIKQASVQHLKPPSPSVPDEDQSSRLKERCETEAKAHVCTPCEAHGAVAHVFANITQSDVRQAAGRAEHNVGEMSVEGVTHLINRCQLQLKDIFLDVGSGLGNVVAQVALQSPVSQAIGIEIRNEVASLGSKAILDATPLYPRLFRAVNDQGDVVDQAKYWSQVADTTVLYSNNFVFTEEANQAVHQLCCILPALRLVVLVVRVCPRHRRRCTNEFCLRWREEADPLPVQTEYQHRPVQLHVYRRRIA